MLFQLPRTVLRRTVLRRAVACCSVLYGAACILFALVVTAQADEPVTEVVVENAILKTIETTAIAAQVAGVIENFEAKEGMAITAGQLLGKVRDEAVRIELESLKTAVEVAKKKQQNDIDKRLAIKSSAVADNEYQRAVKANLQVRDTYPINEIDRLKLLADRAKLEIERAEHMQDMAGLEVKQAESEYRKAYEVFNRHKIQSPVTGVIVGVEKHIGEWVEPGVNLLRIVRLDRLRIEGFVNAELSGMELDGRSARVIMDLAGKPHEATAKVVFVSPDVNSVNNQVRVYLELDNSQGLYRPGLRVQTSILTAP